MSIVSRPRPSIKPEPWLNGALYEPTTIDETELDMLADANRIGHFGDASSEIFHPALPMLDWLASRIAWHRLETRQEGDYDDLVLTDLIDLQIVTRDRRARSAGQLVAMPGHLFSGLDLGSVRPDRRSAAAETLDQLGADYLREFPGPLGRLVAAVIFRRADEIESFGAHTLRAYYMALDERVDATASYNYPGFDL